MGVFLFFIGFLAAAAIYIEFRLVKCAIYKIAEHEAWRFVLTCIVFFAIGFVSWIYLRSGIEKFNHLPVYWSDFGAYAGMAFFLILERPKKAKNKAKKNLSSRASVALKRGWAQYNKTVSGGIRGIDVEFENMPLQIHQATGKIRMYGDQSNELCNFLEENITPENYREIIAQGAFASPVETPSAKPYKIFIKFSQAELKDLEYDDFFSGILDSIADAYKKNKIKP